jgi:hypothetical protein
MECIIQVNRFGLVLVYRVYSNMVTEHSKTYGRHLRFWAYARSIEDALEKCTGLPVTIISSN